MAKYISTISMSPSHNRAVIVQTPWEMPSTSAIINRRLLMVGTGVVWWSTAHTPLNIHTYEYTMKTWIYDSTILHTFCTMKIVRYSYEYYPSLLERSHCCRHFCPSSARQETRKAEVVNKWCHNFWTKCFQRKPRDNNLENAIKNVMAPCCKCINKVWHSNRHMHRLDDYCSHPACTEGY